jgi:hypothetical protein
MKRTVNFLISIAFLFIYFGVPSNFVYSESPLQTTGTITATGQFCDQDLGYCGDFTISFNPAGGPVTGAFTATYSTEDYGILHVNGSLVGEFTYTGENTETGEEGGVVIGTITNGIWDWKCQKEYCFNATPASLTGRQWGGYLYSNGTGNGKLFSEDSPWKVTFSTEGFQAGLPTPTEEVLPEPLLPTPTSFDVVALKIELDPTVRDCIANSKSIDDATKAILNQDSAIIARDANNKFYAINNAGESIALPSTLNSYFQMSDQFAILGNDELLASSEHGSIRGTINGGGDFVMLQKIPDELKTRDYAMLTTSCPSATECRPEMKINSTASSTYIQADSIGSGDPTQCKLGFIGQDTLFVSYPRSSEHGSIRGTINGGG